jgi:hypothetical protein
MAGADRPGVPGSRGQRVSRPNNPGTCLCMNGVHAPYLYCGKPVTSALGLCDWCLKNCPQ